MDQKDDIEGATSLIANLDFVISAGASPSMISNGLGIPTFSISSQTTYTGLEEQKSSQSTPSTKIHIFIQLLMLQKTSI